MVRDEDINDTDKEGDNISQAKTHGEGEEHEFVLHDTRLRNRITQVTVSQKLGEFLGDSIKKEKEIVLIALLKDEYNLQLAPLSIRFDQDIVLAAAQHQGMALFYASKSLREDKAVVLQAVTQYGPALQCASHILQNDRQVVLAAVKQCGKALQYASNLCRSDYQIVLTAVQNDGRALEYAPDLQNNKDIVLTAIEQCPKAFRFTSIRGVEILVATAASLTRTRISRFGSCFRHIGYVSVKTILRLTKERSLTLDCNVLIVASKLGLPWTYGMRKLVEEFPADLANVDEESGMCPFMLAASSRHSDLTTIFNMMICAPELVKMFS